MTKTKRHSNAVDMARDLLGDDDPQFAEDVQKQIENRQLVHLLATIRNKKGVTQEDVAKELGCGQAKISKIENGTDDAVTLREIEAYAKATGCDVELEFRSRDFTVVDEIVNHATGIGQCFERLAGLAADDETVARGVARFHLEALHNLANIIKDSAKNLRSRQSQSRLHVREQDDLIRQRT